MRLAAGPNAVPDSDHNAHLVAFRKYPGSASFADRFPPRDTRGPHEVIQ